MINKLFAVIFTVLLVAGCSNQQQDDIFKAVVEAGRDSAGLVKKQEKALDVEMVYLERMPEGEAKGPTIVLAHGFSANKDTWIRFITAIDKKYHVIAIDWAGHGDNERDLNGNYDLFQQADRLHALMQAKGINKFHLAGNSMGGAISAIYAMKYPNELASLALMNSAGIDGKNKSEYFQALEKGSNPLIASDLESFDYRMGFTMSQPPFLPWPLKPALVRITLSRFDINNKIFNDMMGTKERLEGEDFHQKLVDLAAQNPIPTLIMWGEEDRVLDVSAVEEFQKLLPHAEVKVYEGVGHLPMMEIPNKSAEFYESFVAKAES